MNVGGGVTTEQRTRINQPDDGSARCRGSRVPGQPSDSCPSTRPPTTPSTFSVISPPLARTESSELRPCGRGVRSPPRLEPSGVDGFAASAIPQRDNAVLQPKQAYHHRPDWRFRPLKVFGPPAPVRVDRFLRAGVRKPSQLDIAGSLFDPLVGDGKQRRRHWQAERLGGININGKLKLGGSH